MTEQQKSMAIFYMAGQRRIYRDTQRRFMEDGNKVRFTKVVKDAMNNQEYEINDYEDWTIWFSQLSQVHITEDIDDLVVPTITFRDGSKFSLHDMEPWEFYEKVKGKTFRVSTCTTFAAIKPIPDELVDTIVTYRDALEYAKKCIEGGNLERLGKLLKPASLYYLEEI